ncbi:MAG: hypothetical protein ND895_15925 [Pyrinomonadaceae bacterium]|nr:hypothetical protein [Pyrinomonadaceae bacterium]
MAALGALLLLAAVILQIIILIKLFQNEGALKGILGLLCGLYVFIWGWMNATRLNIKNLMIIWTILIILACVVNGMTGGFSYGTMPTNTP